MSRNNMRAAMGRFLVLVILWMTVACAPSPKIGYDYDRGADFSAYRSYAWLSADQEKTGDRRADSSVVDMRIRIAVGTQLRLKGYHALTDGTPDFYVAYHIGLKDSSPSISTQYYSEGMAGHAFSHAADTRSAGKSTPAANEAPASYLTGSLLIDIIDAASQKLVWRGSAAGEVDPSLTSQQRDERTRVIVQRILSQFPPK
ncbi:MAG TPA: DUF4136 domain-containing protein [Nitrospira sp.]|nr:DUF4136 domain-containing protein [Nitrospira sp.]